MTSTSDGVDAGDRDALLDRLQATLVAQAASARIGQAAPGGRRPASFGQRRLWFLDRLDGGNVAYNLPVAARLRGPLDVPLLRKSLDEILRRHEVLRTRFAEDDGEPVQEVGPASGWPLEVVDCSSGADGGRAQVDERLRESAWAPFDLASGPLVRALLLRLADDEHVLGLTMHHAVVDGWSIGVLLDELSALYAAFSEGRPSPLPDLAMQYGDFAAWQREHLTAESLADDLAYWRAHLDGAPAVLELPTDRPRPARPSPAGAMVSATLTAPTADALHTLAAGADATSFMLANAAISLVLGRYAGADDVVVGVPSAGRTRAETAPLIGLFLNTLPLRTDLSQASSFRDLLARVRATTLDTFARQDVPFEQLVEAVRPDRALSHTPIFQVMVNHTSTLAPATRLGPLELDFLDPVDPAAKFPLTLYISEDAGFRLDLVFQTDSFSRERAATVLAALVDLLEQAAADPDRPLGAYALPGPRGADAVADLASPLPAQRNPGVAEVVAEWADRTPDAPAVDFDGETVAYRALQQRADAIRAALGRAGVARTDRVAVTGQPSPGLVAAVLAVLGGGGVLVPLDPELPRHRLRTMAAQAAVSAVVVVGDASTEPGFPVEPSMVVRVEATGDGAAVEGGAVEGGAVEGTPAPLARDADEPAYVFFTSGTTGTPKGVLGAHGGLSHFLLWQRDTFQIAPGDRCAQLTGLSFDVVLRDLLLPLVSGATLLLRPAGGLGPDGVLPWLARAQATVAHAVPTLAAAWLDGAAGPVPLTHTFFAGEPLTDDLVRRWREACPATEVVNLYGPTETTLAKFSHVVGAEPVPGVQPVGRPLPETHVAVLAPDGRQCGVAEPGEVVIRTPHRSLGYVQPQPGDTDRFQANPHTGDSGDLLYRTGDRGRLREDGTLELLGRLDRQVKVRGVRVEPDEVAAVLSGHPAVSRAAVTSKTDSAGLPALVAYIVSPGPEPVSEARLRQYLSKRLPTAMVPSQIAFVDEIPHNANGKVDWAALADIDLGGDPQAAHDPPATPTEQTLAAIWEELLKRSPIGRGDDFFRLGGHSLMAMRLVGRISDSLGIAVPLLAVFQTPTLAGLAAAIDTAGAGEQEATLPSISRAERVPAPPQGG